MKRRPRRPRTRSSPQPARRRRRRVTRQGAIHKNAGGNKTTREVAKPTYFSLLADVEHALKVEHTEGASLQKLKRELEKKYGGRKFNAASEKMLQSAVKRLRNRGRIAKIHPNSSLFRFKPSMMPSNYNFFGPGPIHSRGPHMMGANLSLGKQSMSTSRSMTMSRSTTQGSGSQSTTQGSRSRSTIQGSISRSTMSRSNQRSISTRSRSSSSSTITPTSRSLKVRNLASSAKTKKARILKRR